MPSMKPSPRSSALGAIADALSRTKEFGNKAQIPFTEMGLGDLFLGDAPQEVNEWAYGNAPMRIIGGGTGSLIPQTKQGRAGPLMDATFLGLDAAGLGLGVKHGASALGNRLMRGTEETTNTSRRNFLGQLGALGAAGAAGVSVPRLLQEAAPAIADIAPAAIRQVAEEAAAPVVRHAAAATIRTPNLKSFLDTVFSYNDDFMVDGKDYVSDILGKLNPQINSVFDDTLEILNQRLGGITGDDLEALIPGGNNMNFNTEQEIADFARGIALKPEMLDNPESRRALVDAALEANIDPIEVIHLVDPNLAQQLRKLNTMSDEILGANMYSRYPEIDWEPEQVSNWLKSIDDASMEPHYLNPDWRPPSFFEEMDPDLTRNQP